MQTHTQSNTRTLTHAYMHMHMHMHTHISIHTYVHSRVVAAVANSLLYGANNFSFLHLLCCVKISSPSLLHSSLRLWWQSCSICCVVQREEGDRDCFFYSEIHVSCYPLKLLPLHLCSAAAFLTAVNVTFAVISTSLGPSCPSCTHCFYFYMTGSIIARSQWMRAQGKTCGVGRSSNRNADGQCLMEW